MAKLKIAFFGLGKAGKRHYDIVKEKDCQLFHFKHPIDWTEVDRVKPDIAFICNPTHKHIEVGMECAKRDMQLFIEKPIDCQLDKLDQLLEVINRKKLTAYIAYPYRHHPKIKLTKSLNFINDSTINIVCTTNIVTWGSEYSWKEETGGGVLLELSHEIDYAEYLFGEIVEIEGVAIRNSTKYLIKDRASLETVHKPGIKAHIFLNLLSNKETRFINIDNGSKNVRIDLLDKQDMYERQIKYFFDSINNPALMNNINEASKLFRKIINFNGRQKWTD